MSQDVARLSTQTLTERVRATDRAHVFHSWSAQAAVTPTVIAGGRGSRIWDADGKEYLDFASQLVNVNIGHQHPKVVAAIVAQAQQMCTAAPSFTHEVRAEAAQRIASHAPAGLDRVFFTSGGAEANENAIRLARGHTGRAKVLSAYRSYHGATAGAITVTGEQRRHANEPGVPGAVKFFGPYLYRSAFHATTEQEEAERALEHLRQVVAFEGPERVAAILLESVVGTNGILVPPPGYLAGVRELCDEHGIVMICDEVMSGFARCGEWFAVDRWSVVPDLITFAKGVNSGYVPLGGVIISHDIARSYDHQVFYGGLTYSGHLLACASALASIAVMEDESIVESSRLLGDQVIGPTLQQLQERHECIGDVRGLGTFWAIELVADGATREPVGAAVMGRIAVACKERGLWPFTAANRIHIVPPCNTPPDEVVDGLKIIDEVLGECLRTS